MFRIQYLLNFAMMLEALIRFAVETTIIEKNKVHFYKFHFGGFLFSELNIFFQTQFYGYLILTTGMTSISWIFSLILIYIESCKALPSIPTRGHGIILLVRFWICIWINKRTFVWFTYTFKIFWTTSFLTENLAFISFKGREWFWKMEE